MEKEKIIEFDPGFSPIVIDSIGQVGYTYYMFSAINSLKLKKINYPNIYKKLESLLKVNISFYIGCLIWALYIKKFDNYEISGNKLLNEVCEEKEYTSEIDFLIDFINVTMPKDSKYYLNKPYHPDKRYIEILKTYKDFLILNKGFVNCSNTNQIIIPDNLKKLSDDELDKLNNEIQNAIQKQDLTPLLDLFDAIF